MKKILLLAIALATAVIAFAISASALTEIPEFTEVIDVTVESDAVLTPIDASSLEKEVQGDNESRVLLRDENGDYQTYLSKYITKFSGGVSDHSQFTPYFEALNKATGKTYSLESIVSIEIPEGTLRVSNNYSSTGSWKNVMYVKAPSTLIYQQYQAYNQCKNIKVIDYSKASVANLDQEFITNNSSIEVVYFPANVQNVGKWAIHGTSNLQAVYVPGGMESAESMINSNTGSGKFVFFYTGDINPETSHTKLYTILNNVAVKEIAWDSSKNDAYYIEQAKADCIYIVYGYNHCKAFYESVHDYKGTGNCLDGVECTRCQEQIQSFSQHNMVESLVYESLTLTGVYNKYCTNASDCEVDRITNSEAPAIFTATGFSTKGEDGIAGGYTIDIDALNEYKRINGSLTVGIMVVNPDYLDGKNSFLANGNVNASGGALQVDITENQYKNVNISITGFTGEAESLSLVIALYAYTDADEVEFVQSSTTQCADKNVTLGEQTLYTVTLNSVKSASSDLSSLGDYIMPSQKEQG